jgi:hypothetical protein
MRYNDLLNRITNGLSDVGDDVWLVDVRHEDLNTSNVIPPTLARISTPDNPHVELFLQGSKHYFQPLKNNGEAKTIIVRPFRTVRGRRRDDSIHIFLTEDEARLEYIQQCRAVKETVQQQQDDSNRKFEAQLADLDARISAVS